MPQPNMLSEESGTGSQGAQPPGEGRIVPSRSSAGSPILQTWLADPAIKSLMPLLLKLHTAPKIYAQVTEKLRSPHCSIEDVAQLIAVDPVMSAKLLQVANSAFFGLRSTICAPVEAVMFLGTDRTRALILLAGVFSQFDLRGFDALEGLWRHSLEVGGLAQTIALAETGNGKAADAAYTAGLLHDIGKIILAGNLTDLYRTVLQGQARQKQTIRQAELEVLETTHAEVGACVLGTWGLPMPILEAVYWHHDPLRSPDTSFSLLTAVHAANIFAHESGGGPANTPRDGMALDYLKKLGLADRGNYWAKLCSRSVAL